MPIRPLASFTAPEPAPAPAWTQTDAGRHEQSAPNARGGSDAWVLVHDPAAGPGGCGAWKLFKNELQQGIVMPSGVSVADIPGVVGEPPLAAASRRIVID